MDFPAGTASAADIATEVATAIVAGMVSVVDAATAGATTDIAGVMGTDEATAADTAAAGVDTVIAGAGVATDMAMPTIPIRIGAAITDIPILTIPITTIPMHPTITPMATLDRELPWVSSGEAGDMAAALSADGAVSDGNLAMAN